jgi:crotonobetainyl-CoA:carnitine CoA-transferase CaiB-like acyl-CoA transferase
MPAELNSSGALSGLRVLDLTGRMGGYCGLLLANLGAEVILIDLRRSDAARGAVQAMLRILTAVVVCCLSHKQKVLSRSRNHGRTTKLRALANSDVLIEDRPLGYLDRIGSVTGTARYPPSLVMLRYAVWPHGSLSRLQAPNIVAFAGV